MLRTVMRSVAKFAAFGGHARKDESAEAASKLIMKSKEDEEAEDLARRQARNPCDWGLLSPRQERILMAITHADDSYVDLAGDTEFRDLLKDNSSKVLRHCENLSITKPLPEKRVIGTSPPDDVCVVSQYEAEEPESGGSVNKQMIERAAWSWVQDNVRFKELDTMEKTIYDNEYDGLRRHFPAVTHNHAVAHMLTDHALKDKGLWKHAIKEAMFPTVAPEAPKANRVLSKSNRFTGRRRNSLFGAASLGVPVGASRSKQPPGGRMQKDRSAPQLG
jgi:hypothetical protein